MTKELIDMKDKKIERFLFIEKVGNNKRGDAMWNCRCDCGEYKIVRGTDVRSRHIKSCGCLRQEEASKHSKRRPYGWILAQIASTGSYRKKYGNSKIGSTLTYSDILEFIKTTECHYCGAEIIWYPHQSVNGKQVSRAYNLDRKDNQQGYTKDNCVVCCAVCNYFKGDRFSYEEMLELGKTFRNLREARNKRGEPWVQHYSKLSPRRDTSLINSS